MQNFAVLRAAVIPLFMTNLKGGGADIRPPSVRGLTLARFLYFATFVSGGQWVGSTPPGVWKLSAVKLS